MNCLWCDNEIIPVINWSNLFLLPEPEKLCEPCQGKLIVLDGQRCKKCSRHSNQSVCDDCRWWDKHKDPLILNYSIFQYNDLMQEMIARWKYRGDYCFAEAFHKQFRKGFQQKFSFLSKNAVAVPIPLSPERLMERGFNQADLLARFLPLETKEALSRVHGEKQSKKTRHERISAVNPFRILKPVDNPVVLIDDIYTTGTTIRHAASILKEGGCTEIYALTLVRG
ncbi:ComF family protein [Virgibacillus ihumii]|uniref:ComF family protein n=1 Tax=Virgibacillus ihumii TaxID=2686091 RepID=UPI00157C5D94|nr:ComF family protein [Virgibacillus ihumii]